MHELIDLLMNFISTHQNISYAILFLWSLWEAFFPFSFILYWEVFFLTGSILAWYWVLDIYIVTAVLLIWGVLWDNLSYLLWLKYGDKIISYLRVHKLFWRYISDENFSKVEWFFEKRWWLWIFISRFSWPLAWITPFLAWSFKLKYREFIKYDVLWVVLWIWIFIFAWYIFWKNFDLILNIMWKFILVTILLLIFFVFFKNPIKNYLKNKQWVKKS